MDKFENKTISELKYYVYALTYKKDGEDIIFYIGKGKANRVFSHFSHANKLKMSPELKQQALTDKIEVIMNEDVEAFIVNAGLSEKEALMIEATLINTMRRFKKQSLTNIVRGHKSYTPENVTSIDFKYSSPISMEDFAKDHKVKILALKSTYESYFSAVEKDFRGVLEGIWTLNQERIEQVDYVVGVLKGSIYAVYKYIKGSYRKMDSSWSQDEWDHWNTTHLAMGRPHHYYLEEEDGDIEVMKKGNKGVMKLAPMAIPKSQNVTIGHNAVKKEIELANELINRTIIDEKLRKARQSGRFYFGFEK